LAKGPIPAGHVVPARPNQGPGQSNQPG